MLLERQEEPPRRPKAMAERKAQGERRQGGSTRRRAAAGCSEQSELQRRGGNPAGLMPAHNNSLEGRVGTKKQERATEDPGGNEMVGARAPLHARGAAPAAAAKEPRRLLSTV